jgi:hypothetical protein
VANEPAIDRSGLFTPEHLAVDPAVRRLLQRLLKVERHTLEYTGEDFTGFITFRVPTGDTYPLLDVLTVCAELAQRDLGVTCDVEQWFIEHPADGLVSFQPREYQLQEEDREVPPVGRREFIDSVRPSEGWGR